MEDWTIRLRKAVHGGDAEAVVALERDPDRPQDVLQEWGDGLVFAVSQQATGATEAATRCAEALRARGWVGDAELADQLDPQPDAPVLRPLPIHLGELSELLEGDPMYTGGAIDLHTGQTWPQFIIDSPDGLDDVPDFHDKDRFLYVWSEGSRDGYHDMVDFIDALTDPAMVDRLSIAIQGRGAFRRFRDVLSRWPEEFTRWHTFSDERHTGRARAWLADAGYCVAPQPLPADRP